MSKPNVIILGGLSTYSRQIASLLVPLEGEALVSNLRIVDKYSVSPPTTYIGAEFTKILAKPNVEYRQVNLTIKEKIEESFNPPDGQEPYTIVFDCTGEVRYDRPDLIQIDHTAKLARNIGLEAARRKVKAYVRLHFPFYDTSLEKTAHEEKDHIKPIGVRGTWWHESLRMLGAIKDLNLVVLRPSAIYGPYNLFGLIMPNIILGLCYKSMGTEMKFMYSPSIRLNTVHTDDVAGAAWALAEWMSNLGRAEADKIAGEEIHFANDKSKIKDVEGVPAPDEKVVLPLFNLTDDSDTTQNSLGQTIARVFGIKFGFHGIITSTMAKFNLNDVAEDVNEMHVEAWTKIITTSDPPIPNTPLTPYVEPHLLSKFSVAYTGEKIKRIVGYKLRRPRFDEETVKEVIAKFKEEGTWPNVPEN